MLSYGNYFVFKATIFLNFWQLLFSVCDKYVCFKLTKFKESLNVNNILQKLQKKYTNTTPSNVHHSETTLPRATRHTLAPLRTTTAFATLYIIYEQNRRRQTPISNMPIVYRRSPCNLTFQIKINTKLTVIDLWTYPVEVGKFLAECYGATFGPLA